MTINNTQIARVCHEATRAFALSLGDSSLPAWDHLDDDQRALTVDTVALLLAHPEKPADGHPDSALRARNYIFASTVHAMVAADEYDADEVEVHHGLPVAGYLPQTSSKVDAVNVNKGLEERVLHRLDDLKNDPETDGRWLAIGRTAIEQGFMAVNRSVFKPARVELPGDAAGTQ